MVTIPHNYQTTIMQIRPPIKCEQKPGEKMKHTIDDFILHFVQFTKHLLQDFLTKQTDQSVHRTFLRLQQKPSYTGSDRANSNEPFMFSLPVSSCRGPTSLRRCPPPRAAPCAIKHTLKQVPLCHAGIHRRRLRLSPGGHRPVGGVSSVPRLLCI